MGFIFLRHSNRHKNDLTIEKSLNRVGKYNANICLKGKLKELNISEIYCSPFLTCLQTIDNFSSEQNIPIKIEACLTETLKEQDLKKIDYNLLTKDEYFEMISKFKIDNNYLPVYSMNNLLSKNYSVLNETLLERMELFTDFLNNCKNDDKNILIVSHSSILNNLVKNIYNQDMHLKIGEFLVKKSKIKKNKRKMSLRKSFIV